MKKSARYLGGSVLVGALACLASSASAAAPPSLGSAQSFAVLGGSTITNTGPTSISGNLGVSPGTSVTGFPPGQFLLGAIHAGDAMALAAQNDLTLAYNTVVAEECTANLTGQNLGGLTLVPGVYCFDTTAQLTGALTLDAQGNPAAVFIFKVGSTLTTASGSSVSLIGGASPCFMFWQVGSSATLGTGSSFMGNILALSSITVTTGVSLTGRALARSGAVTLDTSAVTAACAVVAPPVCPTITLTPPTAPNGAVGVAYNQLIAATGGAGPYSFSVSAGAPPAGVGLSAAGLLSGTPTAAATSSFTVRATDVNSCPATQAYTVVVAAAVPNCPAITITPTTVPNGRVGVAYSQALVGSGGTGPYTFAVAAGTLPAGITLSPAGVLAGTPTSAATATFSVAATDANSCAGSVPYTVVVAAAAPSCPAITITPATVPNGRVDVAYSQTLVGSGGTGPYAFTVATGTLPAGITLSSAGVLAGTPTSAATATFSVAATDGNSCAGTVPYTVVVASAAPNCPAITLTPATPPNGTVGVAYSQTIVGSGGTGPYTFGVTTGTLPAGLTLSTAGVLAGTPTAGATSTFTMRGTDANGCFAEAAASVLIATPVPSLPQALFALLALGLGAAGYVRLRYRRRAS